MTSSSSTTASSPHQKPLKKRLAAVARKTYNRVCCDCPEKAPTWAVIIPPPEKAPLSSRDLVAFVCFNCASVHRQLGMSLVRSIALDEWTEYDVESAEQSGNKYVNRIYEGNLKEKDTHADVMLKPIAGAHIASRQRFIKEKYVEYTYYSQSAHFQHVAQRKIEPSTPSVSSRRSSLMVFLKSKDSPSVDKVAAAFAKSDEGTISTSPSTGTNHDHRNQHHSFPVPVPFDSDLASVQQHQHEQSQQQSQQRRTSMGPLVPFSLSSSSSTAPPSSPTKSIMRPRVSIFSKRTSIAVDMQSSDNTGWDLATSSKDDSILHSASKDHSDRSDRKMSSKATASPAKEKTHKSSGREKKKKERGTSSERGNWNEDDAPKDMLEEPLPDIHDPKVSLSATATSLSTSLEKMKGLKSTKKHEDYRDPRRANFHRSTGSIDFNLADDNEDDANTRITAPVSSKGYAGLVPATPRTPKPVLVASSFSTPSPTNSRMSLYNKNRGRSLSRAREKSADHEDKKSSTPRSRRVDRGRSTSAKPRQVSPDKSRASTTASGDRPSSHKHGHSKRSASTPATPASRTPRSTRDRTSSTRVTTSPLRLHQSISKTDGHESAKHQHRSKSSTRHRSSDDTKAEESRPRSSSARPRTDRAESRRREDSRRQEESRRRSSSARPHAEKVEKVRPRSTRHETETDAATPTTPSSRRAPSRSRSTRDGGGGTDRSSRSKDRSQSRSRVSSSRDQSVDDTKASRVHRDTGTQRAARERARSRSRSVDTLGDLKAATRRRQSRSSNASLLSDSVNSKGMAHWDESTDSHGFALDESIRTKEPSTRHSLTQLKGEDCTVPRVTTEKKPREHEPMKITIKRRSSHSNNSSSSSVQSENSDGIKRERSRRVSRGSATTAPSTSAPTSTEPSKKQTSRRSLDDVLSEKGRSQPKDTKSLPSGTRKDNFDGNVSLSLESALLMDEKSVKTAPPAAPTATGRSKRESILKEGEESFQVISAPGRSYSFGLTAVNSKKPNPRDKAGTTQATTSAAFGRNHSGANGGLMSLKDVEEEDMEESSSRQIIRGGHDAYEQSKLRLSRGKAAAKHAERTSRKSEIFAALDQTTAGSDEEWGDAPLRTVPERSKSTTASGGAMRPVIRRVAPAKSRSEMGPKLSTNPSLVVSKAKVEAGTAADSRKAHEHARREMFHQSFN